MFNMNVRNQHSEIFEAIHGNSRKEEQQQLLLLNGRSRSHLYFSRLALRTAVL